MEESKKIKALWLAILALVVLNISVLGWFMFGNKGFHPPNMPMPPTEIPRRLGFDENQIKAFEIIKEAHFSLVTPIRENINIKRTELFNLVKSDTENDSLLNMKVESLSNDIRNNELEILRHIKDIRKICNASQRQIFDEEILPTFNRQPPRNLREIKNH